MLHRVLVEDFEGEANTHILMKQYNEIPFNVRDSKRDRPVALSLSVSLPKS